MAHLIRTVVVDDEPVARRGLRQLLAADPDIAFAGEAGDGAAAVRLVREVRPDLVLLDVQMPELDGFEVAARIGGGAFPVIVFVTAHDEFALRAFEAQALDYLLKPFDDVRFRAVLERAKQQVGLLRDRGGRGAARILVKHEGVVLFQPVERIDWMEGADYFTRLHVGAATQLVAETLTSLEQRLDPGQFMRVHRSAIVNLARVRELRLDYRNRHQIVLTTGARVPLSRARREELERRLAG